MIERAMACQRQQTVTFIEWRKHGVSCVAVGATFLHAAQNVRVSSKRTRIRKKTS